jgi:16S rRNA (cytosine967-C5)-methyltransferase
VWGGSAMRPGGQLAGAIEVLGEIFARHRPAPDALKEWGRAHRFAGAGDRAAIGNLVFDALRGRALYARLMDSEAPRALALAALRWEWRVAPDTIAAWCEEAHGPGALEEVERALLEAEPPAGLPAWVQGNYPEWLAGSFARAFGEDAIAEGAGLSRRAPVDLRVNTLKATRDKVLKALARAGVQAGPWSPFAVRIPPPVRDGRAPNVEAEPAHARGWFEVQDAGSQVAALMTAAQAGQQVVDVCAGAGGKTLALAAQMANRGQIHAYDADRHRLRPIFERLRRAGARNVQVIPADEPQRLEGLESAADVVLVDAPCSGSGSWRRRPDAKWRLTPEALERRVGEQAEAMERGAGLVKPGGRLVYVTCSVLPEENADQVAGFLERHADFAVVPYKEVWRAAIASEPPASADGSDETLLLTPARHDTDGFFIAVLARTQG